MRLPEAQATFIKQSLIQLEPGSQVYCVRFSGRWQRERRRYRHPLAYAQERPNVTSSYDEGCFLSSIRLAKAGYCEFRIWCCTPLQRHRPETSTKLMRIDQTELEEILKQHWDLLLRSLKTLQQSREKTQVYLNKTDLNFEELEFIEEVTQHYHLY